MRATAEPRQAHKAHTRGPKAPEFGRGQRGAYWARKARAQKLAGQGVRQPDVTEEDRRQVEEWLAQNAPTTCPPAAVGPSQHLDMSRVLVGWNGEDRDAA